MGPSRSLRGVAGVAGAALMLVALHGAGWVALSALLAAQTPDPSIPDGDPCCGHPDTWGEVASGLAWTFGLLLVDALLVYVAVGLLIWSVHARWPRLRCRRSDRRLT